MTSEVMTAARDHLVVLLNEQKELLQALLIEEGLLHSRTEDGKERVLDKEHAEEIVEVLDGERAKAERLEITLAVAGTVKAGKSTAVNAIIGTEALPNRARPMTALPTVIRHEPGRYEPNLSVNNAAALDKLAERIAGKLQDNDLLEVVRTTHGLDMKELIEDLANDGGPAIGARYEGRECVFEALRRINDLLRLGRHEAIGEELAVEEYDELHEMPALDVHFRCLADTAQQAGSVALVDLPGFNEARLREHLTKVLKEQLKKASAILVVLDYTQPNTEASEELEILLDAVKRMMQDRIFVLVNKFDQHTSNDPDEAEIKTQISAELMDGAVDREHVYPVSARYAYLASRVLEALDRQGRLPPPEDEPWVDDFRQDAFGRDKGKLDDPDQVRKAADALWADSGFEPLLSDVIVAAQRRAATLALRAPLDKLKEFGDRIGDYLETTSRALTANIKKLQTTINNINEDMETIRKAKEEFALSQRDILDGVQEKIEKKTGEAKRMVETEFDDLFSQEIAKISKSSKRKSRNRRHTTTENKLWSMVSSNGLDARQRKAQEIHDRLLAKGRLEYEDEQEYKDTLKQLRQIYAGIAKNVLGEYFSDIQQLLNEEEIQLSGKVAETLGEISNTLKARMSNIGIEVTMEIPSINLDKKSIRPGSLQFSGHKKRRVESGEMITSEFWDSVDLFDWFGLGKEYYEEEVEYYVITRKRTVQDLKKAMSSALRHFEKMIKGDIGLWAEECETKIDELRTSMDEYNQSLIDGQKQRYQSRKRLEEVIASAQRMKKKSEDGRSNIRNFEETAGEILGIG